MWHYMDPCDSLNKFYRLYLATVVGIISRHDLWIIAYHRKQPNKSKLALYKPLLCSNKQLYISNKPEWFSYKDGCGVCGHTHIKAIKNIAGLGYRQMALGY